MKKQLHILVFFLFYISSNNIEASIKYNKDDWNHFISAWQGKVGTLRIVPNNCRKIYVDVNDRKYFVIHGLSRLFPIRKPIKNVVINKISYESIVLDNTAKDKLSWLQVEFKHPHLKEGGIQIIRTDIPQLNEIILSDFESIIKNVMDFESEEAFPTFITNKKSKIIHFIGSNHLPTGNDLLKVFDINDSLSQGYMKCPLCFDFFPDVPNVLIEKQLGESTAAEVRYYYPFSTDNQLQTKIENIGQTIISKWPIALKGYKYSFRVVESDIINAIACPGGKIFITTGLLNTLESDDEIEAILAHEIAHVEKRHGFRQYQKAKNIALAGTVILAAVSTQNHGTNISQAEIAVGITALMLEVAKQISLTGYSKVFEKEADMYSTIYLKHINKSTECLINVFEKLQYSKDLIRSYSSNNLSNKSHPDIDSRIYMSENTEILPFNDKIIFLGYTKDGEMAAKISLEAQIISKQNNGKNILSCLVDIDTFTSLQTKSKVTKLFLTSGDKTYTLKNNEKTIVYPNSYISVAFQLEDKALNFIKDISSAKINLSNVDIWEKENKMSSV